VAEHPEMPDVNALAMRVQSAWDAAFTRPMDRAFGYRQARVAVETVLAALKPGGSEPPAMDPEPACTCPPGSAVRGGFTTGCPAHAWRLTS